MGGGGDVSAERATAVGPPIVAVGASAGGVEALRDLMSLLPSSLRACVLVVLHVPANSPSALPSILRRVCDLPVRQAEDGERLRAGEVLVARPDHHLVVADGHVLLTRGPQENGHRPAVDVLFRSAARARGPRTLGIVLSGALDDGSAGSVTIASQGGRVAVQDFEEALYDSMPRSAARAVGRVDRLAVAGLAELATAWAAGLDDDRPHDEGGHHQITKEVGMASMDPDAMHDLARPGTPSGFGCPDCAGALFQIEEGNLVRYRCRVGHAWSADSLLARQTVELEGALWVALRSLEEKAALNAKLGERASGQGHDRTAARFQENVQEAIGAAELVRELITTIGTSTDPANESGRTVSG
jgi:two-component system, chemotaxis family, protein-glutamate methylesterase/glutaminase